MFKIKAGGDDSHRYVKAEAGTVLVRPSGRPTRTVAGYLVLSPVEAEALVQELHHWLENERVKNV
jgi:hypothetical protein